MTQHLHADSRDSSNAAAVAAAVVEGAAGTVDAATPATRQITPAEFLTDLPRHVFFTGKGGVGKTTVACASAVALADRGLRVLLVSTDPASNLGDTLGVHATGQPEPCPQVPGLHLLDIDPQAEARAHREALIAPVRAHLPAAALVRMEEQLSGACTQEVAVFDRFTDLLAGDDEAYDAVLYDTAPTGHTLRLLELPGAWTAFLERGAGDASCLGPLAGLDARRAVYARALEVLRDVARCAVVLVSRPSGLPLAESERTRAELEALDVHSRFLVLNGQLDSTGDADPLAAALGDEQLQACQGMAPALAALPRLALPLLPDETLGAATLRRLFAEATSAPVAADRGASDSAPTQAGFPGLSTLVDELARSPSGLLLVMGKGGVGKTTVAAALALGLAERGLSVHLSTTDPANHLSQVLPDGPPQLSVSSVDPHREVSAHREAVLTEAGKTLDADALALLDEDLRSPCTEEVAVFAAFSELLERADSQWVVLDTAPTGHTLLLLDATGAYDREVRRGASQPSGPTPLERLRDGERTHVVLTALAETTPVLEAERLAEDLERAEIRPWAWVLNQVLSATPTRHPLLQARARVEVPLIRRVADHAGRWAAIPRCAEPPRGRAALTALLRPEPAG